MFLLLLPALADDVVLDTATAGDAAPCEPAGVVLTRPAPGQTEVPINVHPGLVWDGACAPADRYTLALFDGETELVSEPLAFPGDLAVSHLDPGEPLSPERETIFKVIPELGRGVVTEIYFTTGTGTAAPLTGSPTLDFGAVFGDSASHTALVEVDVEGPVDPDDLSLVQVLDAVHPERVWGAGAMDAGRWSSSLTLTSWFEGDPVCVIPVIYDALGNRLEGEEVCANPEPLPEAGAAPCGCVTGGGGAGPAWGMLLGLLAVTRRRA